MEANRENALMVVHLKRFIVANGLYEATEEEFHKLLGFFRFVGKQFPGSIRIDENVSYNDPLGKVIGEHAFCSSNIPKSDSEIIELVTKYSSSAS